MTISELYKNEVKRFEEEYIKAYKGILSEEILQNGNPWFNAFLRQTYLNICDQEIERLEWMKSYKHICESAEGVECEYQTALQQDIDYWKREKEIIN